jgi:hypothetical protein
MCSAEFEDCSLVLLVESDDVFVMASQQLHDFIGRGVAEPIQINFGGAPRKRATR